MGSPATRARLTRDERRERILAAGLAVFAERGYEGASMRALAARAGVTTPVLYDHFASKADLHVELLRRQAAALRAAAVRPMPAASAGEFMRATFDAFFGFVEAEPFAWRMLFRDPPAAPEVAAAHSEIMDETTRAIAGLFALTPRWHVRPGLPREVVDHLLAEIVKSALNGLAAWWWDHRDVPRGDLVDLAMDALWTGIERLREPAGPARGGPE